MPNLRAIYQLESLKVETAEVYIRYRAAVARSVAILKESAPDTFLGRPHYEIIPLPHENEEDRGRRIEPRAPVSNIG
jgi:hypothetical protein